MEEITQLPAPDVEVVDIQFRPGQKIYYFDPDGVTYHTGDHVIMDTARGAEYGICTGGNHKIPPKDVVAPLRKILRRATSQDERIVAENRAKEKKAYEVCLQKIADHQLDMQLVSAEVAFDGSKILFYFTADERVDFRELVKNLASVFHTRIELRQIGVRDKAKMVGGLGICGRPFCCASFLEDFQPVSIKMAKTQNLSLNPTKISGTCGRLMCCLKYEQEAYEDLLRTSPKIESFVDTPEGRGTVVEVDLLRQRVKVRMEDEPETISVFPNADIAVLRSGKAKKNDPPIPADLAPISGSGKRVRREETEEKGFLEPIRFRYSTEKIVEEPVEEPAEEPAAEAEEVGKPSRSRRRRRGQSGPNKEPQQPKAEPAPRQEKPKKEPKEPREPKEMKEPKAEPETAEAGEKKNPSRRRPNYRRRRPQKPAGEGQQ
ncbi:MAG: stage 0 sporulation family protein [Oscillospiraceae bacterium]|nr:stage 0 sporulation family protein [Oscillospiraceae bacterium]